jgi:outer membrane protein assembly factor BamB
MRPTLLLALTALAPAALADDWTVPCGGRSTRDGRSMELGPTSAQLLWQGGGSALANRQACAEGNVLVTGRLQQFGQQGGLITAQDLATGALLWPPTTLPVNFSSSWSNLVIGVRDGQIYATRSGNANAEYIYALRVSDGGIQWQSQSLVSLSSSESVAYAPNGDPIVGSFSALLRVDKDTGQDVWNVQRSCPSSDGCHAAVFADANRVYIWEASPTGPRITAFALDTGARLYSSDAIAGGFVQQCGPLVGPDGTVYAPRMHNNAATDFFTALTDTGSGFTEKWRVPLGYVPFASFGVGPDGSVYSYTTTRPQPSDAVITINRHTPDTGAIIDSSPELLTDFPATPRLAIDAAGIVYFVNGGFSRGRAYSFNPDLTIRWETPVPNVGLGGPIIGQGGIMVLTGVGTDVRAYRTAQGCYANCDGSTTPPVLNVADFTCFLTKFAAGDAYANCDGSTTQPVLNVADFTCFLTKFAAGCG